MKYVGLLMLGVGLFGIFYHYSQRILEKLRFHSIGTRDYIVETLDRMFIEVTPGRVLGGMVALTVGLFFFGFLLGLPHLGASLFFGGVLGVLGWFLPKPVVTFLYGRRMDKFNDQMVDGLALLANAMKSGLSLVQGLSIVVDEMPNPISQEFNLVINQTKLGVSVEDAFQNLAKRIPSEDVQMFVTAIVILKETGGNMAETFDTIVYTIRERIKVTRKISAMVAQGYMQGIIVMCIPFVMGAMFYTTDPEFMKPMFTTPLGWVLIAVMLALQVAGGIAIKKVVTIKV